MRELGAVDADELYTALELLGEAQQRIETALAKRQFSDGCLVLFQPGVQLSQHSALQLRQLQPQPADDGKKDKLQIVFDLLCAPHGCSCPIAVEVYPIAIPAIRSTLVHPRVAWLTELEAFPDYPAWFLVGDRGMSSPKPGSGRPHAPAGLDRLRRLCSPAVEDLRFGPFALICSFLAHHTTAIWRR